MFLLLSASHADARINERSVRSWMFIKTSYQICVGCFYDSLIQLYFIHLSDSSVCMWMNNTEKENCQTERKGGVWNQSCRKEEAYQQRNVSMDKDWSWLSLSPLISKTTSRPSAAELKWAGENLWSSNTNQLISWSQRGKQEKTTVSLCDPLTETHWADEMEILYVPNVWI